MQWELRKKGLPDILVKAVMSLSEGTMTKVKVGFDVSEELMKWLVYIRNLFSHLCYLQLW